MQHVRALERYLKRWEASIRTIVQSKGSRVEFPSGFSISQDSDSVYPELPQPICFHDAPQKGSSNRRGPSHRLTIFVDGKLELNRDEAHPCLRSAGAVVEFYEFDFDSAGGGKLTLVDCFHFDLEWPTRPFHPACHVQRGTGVGIERVRNVVSGFRKVPAERLTVDVTAAKSGTPYLRLPSPQMDLFAVLTMIVADFYCGAEDDRTDKRAIFTRLLGLLANPSNVVRECAISSELRSRIVAADFMSMSYWYPEYRAQ